MGPNISMRKLKRTHRKKSAKSKKQGKEEKSRKYEKFGLRKIGKKTYSKRKIKEFSSIFKNQPQGEKKKFGKQNTVEYKSKQKDEAFNYSKELSPNVLKFENDRKNNSFSTNKFMTNGLKLEEVINDFKTESSKKKLRKTRKTNLNRTKDKIRGFTSIQINIDKLYKTSVGEEKVEEIQTFEILNKSEDLHENYSFSRTRYQGISSAKLSKNDTPTSNKSYHTDFGIKNKLNFFNTSGSHLKKNNMVKSTSKKKKLLTDVFSAKSNKTLVPQKSEKSATFSRNMKRYKKRRNSRYRKSESSQSKKNSSPISKNLKHSYYIGDLILALSDSTNSSNRYIRHIFQNLKSVKLIKNILTKKNCIYDYSNKYYIPKHNLHGSRKKTLLFDLDETLVHCDLKGDLKKNKNSMTIKITLPSSEIVNAHVNIRPHAKQILRNMSRIYEVGVFTASHQCYAEEVVRNLDPDREFISMLLTRKNCVELETSIYVKDLRVLKNRNIEDIILIDNAAYSYGLQLDNGIPCIPFYDNVNDNELMKLEQYLRELKNLDDIKLYNRKYFKNYLLAECEELNEVCKRIISSYSLG